MENYQLERDVDRSSVIPFIHGDLGVGKWRTHV